MNSSNERGKTYYFALKAGLNTLAEDRSICLKVRAALLADLHHLSGWLRDRLQSEIDFLQEGADISRLNLARIRRQNRKEIKK